MGRVADDGETVGDRQRQGVVAIAGESQGLGIGNGFQQAGDLGPQAAHLGLPPLHPGAQPIVVVGGLQAPEEGGEPVGTVRAGADREDADHARGAAIDLFQPRGVERIAGPGDGGPQGAPFEFLSPSALFRQEVAGDGGAGARGVDDQVEGGTGPAAGVSQAAVGGGGDLPVGLERDAPGQAGVVKDLEDGGAVDAQGVDAVGAGRLQVGVADVEHDASASGFATEDVFERLAERLDPVRQAEAVQHMQAGRLEHEAGADRARFVEPLVDHDAPTLTRQHEGEGQAGRAGADDGDGPGHLSWGPVRSDRGWTRSGARGERGASGPRRSAPARRRCRGPGADRRSWRGALRRGRSSPA